MSFEALPNEMLVKIFSYLSWELLRDLSPVNQRWNQVIGQRATLNISKWSYRHNVDICIPLEVLCGSSREYSKFSCSLMELQMMSGTFGAVLEYCREKWKISNLQMRSQYDQFILFLQHHKQVLKDVLKADISVYGNSQTAYCSKRFTGFLSADKLQQLNLDYKAFPFYSLSLHAPMLEFLKVDRYMFEKKLHLTLHDCTKLHSISIRGYNNSSSSTTSDPVELESILPQAAKTTMLEITRYSIETTFRVMFGNLQTIILSDVTIPPTDNTLECLNLTRLELHSVLLLNPLKLRVPQLHTVICNMEVLQSLHLQDALKADLLAIYLTFKNPAQNETVATFPGGLSSFRRLHLLLWITLKKDDTLLSWLWPHLSGIKELKLQSYCRDNYFHQLRGIWRHFPLLNSLRLLKMGLPNNFNFLPGSVQNVTIEDSSTEGNSIEFPPSVERVRIKKLWNKPGNSSRYAAGMALLPPNQYTPLESKIVLVKYNFKNVLIMVYSTKDWRDMQNFNPLPESFFVSKSGDFEFTGFELDV